MKGADVEVRTATIKDRPRFAALWNEFMKEKFEITQDILPNEENALEYMKLFESYLHGSLVGFPIIALEDDQMVGCALAGENFPGGIYLKSAYGRCATLWGIYTIPEYRQKGISHKMLAYLRALLIEEGFENVFSSLHPGDQAAEKNAYNFGATLNENLIIYPLQS